MVDELLGGTWFYVRGVAPGPVVVHIREVAPRGLCGALLEFAALASSEPELDALDGGLMERRCRACLREAGRINDTLGHLFARARAGLPPI